MTPCGLLLIDKPAGPTSHDVVAKLRRSLGLKAVGHAGTLDPQATGLMVLALGAATRWLEHLEGGKVYIATLRLGLSTSTEDVWGETLETHEGSLPSPEAVRSALEGLRLLTEQVPPMVSALKQDGQRLYDLARQGKVVERKARPIKIDRLTVTALRGAEADFEVACSAGTYVRSLCSLAGQRLGCGAAMAALRRIQSGPFSLGQAITLEQACADPALSLARLLDHEQALGHLPAVQMDAAGQQALLHGRCVPAPGLALGSICRLVSGAGELLALATVQDQGQAHPDKVFAHEGL